jgi:hypothetical protein
MLDITSNDEDVQFGVAGDAVTLGVHGIDQNTLRFSLSSKSSNLQVAETLCVMRTVLFLCARSFLLELLLSRPRDLSFKDLL